MKITSINLIKDLADVISGTYYGSFPVPSKTTIIEKSINEVFRNEFQPDMVFLNSVEKIQPFYSLIAEQVILRGEWLTNEYNINNDLFIPDNPGKLMQSALFLIPFNIKVPDEMYGIANHFRKCSKIIDPILNDLCKEMIQNKDKQSFIFLPEIKQIEKSELTHRQKALLYDLKVQAKYEKPLTRIEMREIGGKNYEKAFDSINSNSKQYRPIKKEEIESICIYLQDYPDVLKLAQDRLKQFE